MLPGWTFTGRLALGIALVGIQLSCGGQGEPRTTSAEPAPAGAAPSRPEDQPPADGHPPAVMIEITRSGRFYPETVVIRPGDTVQWFNNSDQVHSITNDPASVIHMDDVTAPAGAAPFGSGYLEPGKTFRVRFTKEGEYRYVCFLHESQGMSGAILVSSWPGP